MREILRECWARIRRDRLRSCLTLSGIMAGSMAIVFLGSALSMVSALVTASSQEASGEDTIRIRPVAGEELSSARTTRPLAARDARALAGLGGSTDVAGNALLDRDARVGTKHLRVGIQSGGSDFARMMRVPLQSGRWLTGEDDGKRVCMIGHDVWQTLFGGAWPLPDDGVVLDGATRLRVVGVMAPRPPMGASGDATALLDRRVWVSSATLERTLDGDPGPPEIVQRLSAIGKSGELPSRREAALRDRRYLQNLHGGVFNFAIDALAKPWSLGSFASAVLGAVVLACALTAIAVGGVNVMSSQLVVLAEKQVEYGLRRALGLSARGLERAVLLESLTLTTLASVAGTILGALGAFGVRACVPLLADGSALSLPTWPLALALGSSSVVGVLAGWVPARSASRIVPAKALKAE